MSTTTNTSTQPTPGTPATFGFNGDRRPCLVVDATPTGSRIWVVTLGHAEYTFEGASPKPFTEQSFEATIKPEVISALVAEGREGARATVYTRRKNGAYKRPGQPMRSWGGLSFGKAFFSQNPHV